MHRLRAVALTITVLGVLAAWGAAAAHHSMKIGARADDFVVSEMRVQAFPAVTYLYTQHQTTLAEIGDVVRAAMEQMGEAIAEGKVPVAGPPLFIYTGATAEMDKPFDLQIGFPVHEGAAAEGDMKLRDLPAFRCATAVFSGSMAHIGQAYQQLFAQIGEAGLVPTGETREMHLYFESPESPNNVVLIQAGVK